MMLHKILLLFNLLNFVTKNNVIYIDMDVSRGSYDTIRMRKTTSCFSIWLQICEDIEGTFLSIEFHFTHFNLTM
jgi:hypothetical protein